MLGERFGSPRNTVYALLVCGAASVLASQWQEADVYLQRAEHLVELHGAGREWTFLIGSHRSLCLAELGVGARGVERALDLIVGAEGADNTVLYLLIRALRVGGGLEYAAEAEAVLAGNLREIHRCKYEGLLAITLPERAALARLRGDTHGMARDLAEARSLFAKLGVTGWDDYARSIEA